MKKLLLAVLAVSLLPLSAMAQAPLNGHGIAQRLACASTTGSSSSTAYACSTSPTFTPKTGDVIFWAPGANDLANTTPSPTINVNALGAKPISNEAGVSTALDAGDVGRVTSLSKYMLVYDGTNWQLQSPVGNTASLYTNSIGTGLDAFYAGLRKTSSKIVRIGTFTDSILACYQVAPCNFGPFNQANSPMFALRTELCKQYGCYSTGIRPIWRITGTTTPDPGEGGYTSNTGTWSTSTVIGPQETTPPAQFSGQSLGKLTSGGIQTITVGQAWSKVIIYCATNATSNGWTPTIGGVAQSNVCTATPGAATANAVTITNPNTIAAQGATPSTLTFTALGNNSMMYGYEAVLTNNNFGLVVDNMGVGAISAVWWQGLGTDGLVWWDLATSATNAQAALCIVQSGANDASGGTPRTSAQFNADLQVIGTNCVNKAASVLMMVPPPFNAAAYTTLQQGMIPYAQAQGWDLLTMSDNFRAGNAVLQGLPDFATQNSATNLALNLTDGTMADNVHLTDIGAWNAFNQLYVHLFGRLPAPRDGYGMGTQITSRVPLTTAYTNSTTTASSIVGWAWSVYKGQTLIIDCQGDYQAAATGGLRMQITGPAMTAMRLNVGGGTAQATAFNAPTVTAPATLTAGTAVTTATTNFPWKATLYVNPSASGTVQIQAASVAAVNLTIGVGSYCTAR